MHFDKTSILWTYFTIFLLFAVSVSMVSCTGKEKPPQEIENYRLSAGKKLAQKYCSSCHMGISPKMLPRKIWTQHVLPAMATRLGIDVWSKTEYYLPPGQKGKQGITLREWKKIVAYFKEKAPEELEPPKPPIPLQKGGAMFEVRKSEVKEGRPVATTAMVAFSPGNQFIYTADAVSHQLYRWDRQLQPHYLKSFAFPPVSIHFLPTNNGARQAVITTIGTMRAVNSHRGRVLKLALGADSASILKTIAEDLPRPVQAAPGDFNKDGLRDWIICSFGHEIGGLYLAQQQPDGTYQQSIIRDVPGALDMEVRDFNQDGWPDLMVLFAHGNEGIWLFLNDQQGGFTARTILRFPPVYGSSSFQLVDFNEDSLPDIVYTNGDNADYSTVLKPYHGLHIFMNQGNYRYEEAYFYPIHGAYKALARDFDGDGDQDIATIAFFPDFKNKPDESFLYFEQKEPLQFTPHAVSVYKHGRWISMDAGDFDGDGDPDIVLGNFSRGLRKSVKQGGVEPYWDEDTPFTLLVNQIGG